ncbi:MAG: hypothetical protein RKE49_07710 [Oceanicaulis sp.]
MDMTTMLKTLLITGAAGLALTACAVTPHTATAPGAGAAVSAEAERAQFEADRQAILAMAGEYSVTFDFTEFLPIAAGYELKEPKVTPAREVVYVIEDEGDFISLQHLLLVGPPNEPTVIKHWRQDWAYEPDRLMAYQGFNAWEMLDVADDEADGAWSQTVYQVDDSPRYAGLARWEHAENASTWEPASSYRPLPRRDATTRDDYDVIDAVNRHTVTAWGWTHEQDNSKVVLRDGTPRELVREHGVNTYTRTDLARDDAAETYWAATEDYWAEVRDAWDEIMLAERFSTEDDADGTLLYGPVLSEGQAVFFQAKTTEDAFAEAAEIIEMRVTADGEAVEVR